MKNFTATIVLVLVCGWANAQFSGGTGTPGNPYQITSPAELNNLRNYLGATYAGTCFKLMNDIDLTAYLASGGDGYTLWGMAGWEPIGVDNPLFKFYG